MIRTGITDTSAIATDSHGSSDGSEGERVGSTSRVSVVVATFRRFHPLLDTLRDLLAQSYPLFEIIVGDQNEAWPHELQGEVDRLKQDPRIRWLVFKRPGVVATRNACVRQSSGEIILFVDDDVQISDRDFIARHARNYENEQVDAVAGREWRPAHETTKTSSEAKAQTPVRRSQSDENVDMSWIGRNPLEQTLCFDRTSDRRTQVCAFSTCNGSIRRKTFSELGGFDESFGGNSYGDDYDLAIRLANHGGTIVYDPAAALVHLAAPIGGLRLVDKSNPFSQRDRALAPLIFFFRHARAGWYWHLFYRHVLRKTALLRPNVLKPWRQPAVWVGLLLAVGPAWRASKSMPKPWLQSTTT